MGGRWGGTERLWGMICPGAKQYSSKVIWRDDAEKKNKYMVEKAMNSAWEHGRRQHRRPTADHGLLIMLSRIRTDHQPEASDLVAR